MAEVGLLPFARVALQVSQAVLPRYRSRFSKRLFNQPQLLAILCLMRYQDWTFREAEVRLGKPRELRQALGLARVPDFTTLYRFLKRLDDVTIDRAVGETVRRLRGTRQKGRRKARVAVDATGLAQGAVSTAYASSRAETAAVAARAPVGGRRGFGSAVPAGSDRATRSLERLRKLACGCRDGFPTNADRPGAGRCRVRQRKEPYLHPETAWRTERDSRQTGKENLAHPRRAHPEASSPAARPQFQSLSPLASLTFLEDVNRARWLLD